MSRAPHPKQGTFDGTQSTLVTGSLRGFRCWDVVHFSENTYSLTGTVHSDYIWSEGKHTARCIYTKTHDAPASYCVCGIYGWYTQREPIYMYTGTLIGVTENTGRILLGTHGFRAQKSTIVALAPHPLYRYTLIQRRQWQFFTWRKRHIQFGPNRWAMLYPTHWQMMHDYPPDRGTLQNLGISASTRGYAPLLLRLLTIHQMMYYTILAILLWIPVVSVRAYVAGTSIIEAHLIRIMRRVVHALHRPRRSSHHAHDEVQ